MSTNVTIKGRVEQDKEHLSTCSYQELLTWANEHGIDNRSAWGKYKAALKEIGVDFDALRGASRLAKRAELIGSATHRLLLYSDAKASMDRFGICGPDREPVWYGKFFDNDKDYFVEQSSGELAAAKKAVWLASRVAERLGGVIELELRVDAEWLCWANNLEDNRGGRARLLAQAAQLHGVALDVIHILGRDNPADRWTVAKGYLPWQETIERLAEQADVIKIRDIEE